MPAHEPGRLQAGRLAAAGGLFAGEFPAVQPARASWSSSRSPYFCGNFGDPAVVPELIDIVRYCWDANPRLRLRVHSNASVRPTAWWEELARAAAGRPFLVVAGIDGASQESNCRYRRAHRF